MFQHVKSIQIMFFILVKTSIAQTRMLYMTCRSIHDKLLTTIKTRGAGGVF